MKKNLNFFPVLLISLMVLSVACEETNDKVDEYANWKERNLAYWDSLSVAAEGSGSNLKKMASLYGKNQYFYYEEIEIVNFKDEMDREGSPLSTDTVNIHYKGRLINDVVFDQTYSNDEFDLEFVFDSYKKGTAGSFVAAFSTALQCMKRGDHWKIYIPSELGYGTAGYGSVPGHSTMIFDIILEDFWPPQPK